MTGVQVTARYSGLHASYWSGFCLVVSFSSVFLLAAGLSNTQIGLVVAIAGAISSVLQPAVAGLADGIVSLRRLIVALSVVMVATAAVLLVPGAGWLLAGICYGLLICTIQIILPLINAVGMACVARGIPVNYGAARAIGSAAYAVTSLAVGRAVAAAGASVIPVVLIGLLIAQIIATVWFVAHVGIPSPTSTASTTWEEEGDDRPVNWRRFVLLLVGITLAFVSHNVLNTFLFQVIAHLGGTASEMGAAFTLAALLELPAMFGFTWLVTRWTSGTLLKVSAVFFAFKALAAFLAPDVLTLFLAQILQAGSFALFIPASVYYVEHLLAARDRVRGQSYMTLVVTLSAVIGSLVGGVLLDWSGVPAMLGFGVVIGGAGAALMLVGAERV